MAQPSATYRTMGYAFVGEKITHGFILLIFSHHPDSFNYLLSFLHISCIYVSHILCGMRQGAINTLQSKLKYSNPQGKKIISILLYFFPT